MEKLLKQIYKLQQQIKSLEKELKPLKEELKTKLIEKGFDDGKSIVEYDSYKAVLTMANRINIDRKKLEKEFPEVFNKVKEETTYLRLVVKKEEK